MVRKTQPANRNQPQNVLAIEHTGKNDRLSLNKQLALHASLMPSLFSHQHLTPFVQNALEQDTVALSVLTAVYYSFLVTFQN